MSALMTARMPTAMSALMTAPLVTVSTHPGGDPMTTLTAPAPAVAPTVPPMPPPIGSVTLAGSGALSGCLGLAAVWHLLWRHAGTCTAGA